MRPIAPAQATIQPTTALTSEAPTVGVQIAPQPVPTLPAATISQASGNTARLAKATATPKSDLIKKFGARTPITEAVNNSTPAPLPVDITNPIAPSLDASSNITTGRSRLSPVEPADAETSDPLTPANTTEMPNATLRQAENLKTLAPPATTATLPAPRGLASLKPTSVAAAAIALAIMGSYIWVKNYPNYALKLASDQAGFEASMPNYLPGAFSLAGPIAAGQGQVSLNFNSPNDGPLTLKQTKTSWDSSSLLENYVTKKADKYLSVQNHGLTIYLYNGNQAAWVNHGIWYTLEGNAHLARDQVFKIINSL